MMDYTMQRVPLSVYKKVYFLLCNYRSEKCSLDPVSILVEQKNITNILCTTYVCFVEVDDNSKWKLIKV